MWWTGLDWTVRTSHSGAVHYCTLLSPYIVADSNSERERERDEEISIVQCSMSYEVDIKMSRSVGHLMGVCSALHCTVLFDLLSLLHRKAVY